MVKLQAAFEQKSKIYRIIIIKYKIQIKVKLKYYKKTFQIEVIFNLELNIEFNKSILQIIIPLKIK